MPQPLKELGPGALVRRYGQRGIIYLVGPSANGQVSVRETRKVRRGLLGSKWLDWADLNTEVLYLDPEEQFFVESS
jgi:hypothetical protein